jgi:S1-C subfamily serine protease
MLKSSVLAVLMLLCSSVAQVAPPKHESRWHHILTSHREPENLEQRFTDIKCALVLIEAGPKAGTGFYISGDGDLVTASHVIGERAFSRNADKSVNVSMTIPSTIGITNSKGERSEIPSTAVEQNPDAWLADVALIRTGKRTSCWLREVDDRQSQTGEHLVTIGFPGLSFKTLTLYTGIMSARLTTNLPTVIVGGEAVPPTNEFIRVQMPISTGLSGAPVIDDENRVLAVVTLAGGWSQDLENLTALLKMGILAQLQGAAPVPTQPQPPNTITITLNPLVETAELAGLFHDYASPGYGDAVPLRYLRKQPQQNPPSASPAH